MGIKREWRCKETALLLDSRLGEIDKLKLALSLHALYSAYNHVRHHSNHSLNLMVFMRILVRKAAE
eukprot:6023324-Karenia_brevis.AAC.1